MTREETLVRPFLVRVPVGVVEVRGGDRASFLNAVLSQEIEDLPVGAWAAALLLDAHGSPLAAMEAVALADRVLLLLDDPAAADELARLLRGRTFLADVDISVATDVTRWSLRGSPDEVAKLNGPRVAERAATEGDAGVVIGRADGFDVVAAEGSPLVDALAGVTRGDRDDLEAWRVARGEPRWGHEIRPPHLPEELGLLPTHVHLQKGCYPGQEAVARMWMLGRPRRRLATVKLVGDAAAGWSTGEGKQRVEVTSAADGDGVRVGLAFVPADAQPEQRFGDEGAGVIVRGFVGADRPIPGWDGGRRRRDRR